MAPPKDDERLAAVVPGTAATPKPEVTELRSRPSRPTPPGIWPPMLAAALMRGGRGSK